MSYKSLLTRVGEAFDLHRQDRQQAQPTRPPLESRSRSSVRWWLPTPGNVIFTLLVIGSLLWAQNAGSINLGAPNATWEQVIAHRVEFLACQLVGFNALEAHLQNVRFQGCNGQFAGFRFATCKSVRFEQCDLRHADFQRADLSGVVFHKCDLSHAQLSGATLKGTDFRGSTIDDLRVGLQELPGAIVDHFQAAYIAGLLGVVIKEEGES